MLLVLHLSLLLLPAYAPKALGAGRSLGCTARELSAVVLACECYVDQGQNVALFLGRVPVVAEKLLPSAEGGNASIYRCSCWCVLYCKSLLLVLCLLCQVLVQRWDHNCIADDWASCGNEKERALGC